MSEHGVNSEVGRLRTVMLHRPGPELKRLTPRNNDRLLFDGIPWVEPGAGRARRVRQALRDRGVEVLYLVELLTETLASDEARGRGDRRRDREPAPRRHAARATSPRRSRDLAPEQLAATALRGRPQRRGARRLRAGHQPAGRTTTSSSTRCRTCSSPATRASGSATTSRSPSLAMPARERETQLTELIYTLHPRFAGTPTSTAGASEYVEGGDVLLLAPGVVAVGVGERTTPAGAERLARQMFGAGLAETVLAVPIAQERATMHLDTVCTMVDVDKIVMYPNVADHLQAYAVTVAERHRRRHDHDLVLDVAAAEPFLVAAAKAMRHRHAAPDRHRARPGHRRARAVGRRQQHAGDRAAGGGRLRAQHRDQRAAGGGRHRGDRDRRLRARLRPRRAAVHVLPDRPRPRSDVSRPGGAGRRPSRRRSTGARPGRPAGRRSSNMALAVQVLRPSVRTHRPDHDVRRARLRRRPRPARPSRRAPSAGARGRTTSRRRSRGRPR